jgi:hypothetical protein
MSTAAVVHMQRLLLHQGLLCQLLSLLPLLLLNRYGGIVAGVGTAASR